MYGISQTPTIIVMATFAAALAGTDVPYVTSWCDTVPADAQELHGC